jgi:hypothetical protein
MSGEVERLSADLNGHHLLVLDILSKTNGRLELASREQDVIRRKLRERGLIAYCGKPKRWQISAKGLAVRAFMKANP